MTTKRGPLFQVLGTAAVAVLSVVVWFAWLGWDDGYQTDPVTGAESGPYEVWQIAGCGVSLLILLVAAELAGVRALPASAALVLGFAAAWIVDAARSDETGLFMVGAIMLVGGLSAVSALVSAAVTGIRGRRGAARP